MDLSALQSQLGYVFLDKEPLVQALTHRSHGLQHNERMEFLGDSIINCLVAHWLYKHFALSSEGELHRMRASLVSEPALAEVAKSMQLGTFIRMGEGEIRSGGSSRASILADTLEAIVGAVFIEGGFSAAENVIHKIFAEVFTSLQPGISGKDAKTLLKELLQSHHLALPQYHITAIRGQSHEQFFEVQCTVESLGIQCLGNGTSRRRAEQQAAQLVYLKAQDCL